MYPGAGMSVRHTAHSACILVLAHHLQYNASWCWYEWTTHRSQCMHPGAGTPLTVQCILVLVWVNDTPLTVHASWCWHTTYSTMYPGAGMSVRHTAHSACILVLAHHLQYNASWCWYECTTHRSQCMHPGAGTPLTVQCILVLVWVYDTPLTVHVSWCTVQCILVLVWVHGTPLECTHPGAGTPLTVHVSWCWYECTTYHLQCMYPSVDTNVQQITHNTHPSQWCPQKLGRLLFLQIHRYSLTLSISTS